jgi:hypothetical protein
LGHNITLEFICRASYSVYLLTSQVSYHYNWRLVCKQGPHQLNSWVHHYSIQWLLNRYTNSDLFSSSTLAHQIYLLRCLLWEKNLYFEFFRTLGRNIVYLRCQANRQQIALIFAKDKHYSSHLVFLVQLSLETTGTFRL